jgi:hypothetical protein
MLYSDLTYVKRVGSNGLKCYIKKTYLLRWGGLAKIRYMNVN